jgi:TP901 family phage tail tape measure protein
MFKLAELFVAITGDDRPLNRTLAGVNAKLLGFGAAGTRAGGALVAGLAGGMGAAMPMLGVAGGVAGVGLALGKSAQMASAFESQVNLLGRVTGATAGELQGMSADIRAMATSADLAGVSLQQLGEAAVMGGRMGIGADEMKGFVQVAAELALALDDIPVEASVQGITQILGVYGKGVDEARNFAGALDALSNSAKTTGGEILDVASRLKGSASVLNMSPQDLLALSTAMKDVGLSTEVAGTNMSVILSRMAQDTKSFAETAGVSVKEFEALLDSGPLQALEAFIGGLSGGRDDFGLLAELGITGARATGVVLQLSQSMERLTDFQKMSNEEWESMAFLNADLAAVTQSSEAKMTRSWNRVSEVMVEFGEATLPSIIVGLEGIAEAAEGVRGALDAAFEPGAAARFAASLRESIDASKGLSALSFDAGGFEGFDKNLGKSMGLALIRGLGLDDPGLLGDFAGRLERELIDGALKGIDLSEAAKPIPPKPSDYVPSWDPAYEAGPLEGFKKKPAAAGEFGLTLGLFDAVIAGALQSVAIQGEAKARAAEEFAVRREAEDREARGVGRSVELEQFARDLQRGALGGGSVAEKQLKAQEDALKLERLQEKHLDAMLKKLDRLDGTARAS